ncbi:hypothetical protein JCM19233_122 [Vibrio astriarenae]|nr:hypothetical protein JCM19233_122 [Vibrio sp. C7]
MAKTVDCGFGLKKFRYSPAPEDRGRSIQPVFLIDTLKAEQIDSVELLSCGPVFDVATMWRSTEVDVAQLARLKKNVVEAYDLIESQPFPLHEFGLLLFNLTNGEFNRISNYKEFVEQALNVDCVTIQLGKSSGYR